MIRPFLLSLTLATPALASATPERPDVIAVTGCPMALPDVPPAVDHDLTSPASYCDGLVPLPFDGTGLPHAGGPR